MRIHALTTDRGGCWFFRVWCPMEYLARAYGHHTSYGASVPADLLDQLSDPADPGVLVTKFLQGERETHLWESIARAPRRPLLVYDVDDSYYHVRDMYLGDRSVYADPETLRRAERVIAAADVVTCSTPEVASLYRRLNPNIHVLPNYLPSKVFTYATEDRPANFTLGYQCSPSHLIDIQRWHVPLTQFVNSSLNIRVHFFGPEDVEVFTPWKQLSTPWIEDLDEFHKALAGRFHVGIAPINPDLRFNAYKSGVKAQTYSALGVPTVATDMSYYRDVIVHNETGFLVRTGAQWKAALTALKNEPELARVMGVRAYEREMQQTFESKVYLWNDLYTKERP